MAEGSTTIMTSHQFARQLIETAEAMLAREDFELQEYSRGFVFASFGTDKTRFLAAVRAMGTGRKTIGDYNVEFRPRGTILDLSINRDAVCRKIQDVKWECEPLLSPEEDALMDTHEEVPSDIPF